MIFIDIQSKESLYLQIYKQIRDAIFSGELTRGMVMTGSRTLAKSLGVGRNTVDSAYAQLAVEGYIQSQKGVGFVVLPTMGLDASNISESPEQSLEGHQQEGARAEAYLYDFRYGGCAYHSFPTTLWKRYTSRVLESYDPNEALEFEDKQGDFVLREALVAHMKRSRSVSCKADQIIIGSGLGYSLEIVCKLFDQQERIIAMEEPGYPGTRSVFENNGCMLESIPVTSEGWNLSALQTSDATAVYITPSHQFPVGCVMPIQVREQLLHWATSRGKYIIEDDYDSEFRYNTKPVPALQSFDSNDHVIYIGTFSKPLSPSMRINYMVLPRSLLSRYQQVYRSYKSSVSWLNQRVLALFIAEGHYERHIRKMCLIYKKRHDAFVKTAMDTMGDNIILHGLGAGLHFVLEFPNGEEQDWLIAKARESGVRVYSTIPFWQDRSLCPKNTVYMGYSILEEQQIEKGLRILSKAWFGKK
jgi:GntR family transcriptional regulator/MocR family aminotransferase